MELSRKDFLSIRDFSRSELDKILAVCSEQKPKVKKFELEHTHPGRVLGCIFHKPSLRTRISFEVAVRQLGGSSLFITDREIGIGNREDPRDVANVLSRYLDAIMIRTFDQSMVDDLAKYAEIPVINGLTDLLHPCQVMGDIFTIIEKLGDVDGKKIVFIGDGNNVSRSWLNAAAKFSFQLILCAPEGYEISQSFLDEVRETGDPDYKHIVDPREAVPEADVIYTDVWASMGQEDEASERRQQFQSYQVNRELMELAGEECIFMHCLPAHRGDEVTDEVIDSSNSVVYQEAENRMHLQRAILSMLMK